MLSGGDYMNLLLLLTLTGRLTESKIHPKMSKKDFFSTAEVARLLGISRIAVFKKIKTGRIPAEKIGRSFTVSKKDLPEILGKTLSTAKKKEIEAAVKKTVKEYGETLKLLGKE